MDLFSFSFIYVYRMFVFMDCCCFSDTAIDHLVCATERLENTRRLHSVSVKLRRNKTRL